MNKLSTVSLVPFTWEHVRLTFDWIRDPDFRHLFLMRGQSTWNGHQAYFKRVLADSTQRVFAILVDGLHVGNCGLKNLDSERKTGELWIYVGDPSTRGKRIGRLATELLLREASERLGLMMIYLNVADFNIVARRLYEQLGFVEVPWQGNTGEWTDHVCKIIRMELRRD